MARFEWGDLLGRSTDESVWLGPETGHNGVAWAGDRPQLGTGHYEAAPPPANCAETVNQS